MDPEDQKPKITLANFFESIKGTNAIAQRALKMSSGFSKAIKESSDLVEVNKQDILELQRKVATISQDVTNIQDYIEDQQERRSRELDKREDEVFEKEDKLQKEFKGEDGAKGAGGATSTADALGKGAGAFLSSGLGFGLMGLNALISPRSVGEIFGGTVDAITGNFTDFDKRGGETGGVTRSLGGIVDFFTANMFDLDKRGGLFESKESFERRKEIDEKKKEEKKNRPKKGLMRLLPFNDGGKVFDNVYKSPKLLSFNLLPFNDGGKVFDNDGNSSNNNVDSVLAMLTPGEFVMKKEAVDRLGEGFLASLNDGEKVSKNPYKVENTNTPDFALLTAISALEGGDPQARVDVAQSIYNRLNEVKKDIADGSATDAVYDYTRESFETDKSGVFPEPTISDIILKDSQYQPAFIDPTKKKGPKTAISDEFKNVKDRESAILAMKSYYDKRKIPMSIKQIENLYDQTVIDLQDQKMNKSASAFVGGRTEFESGDSFKMGDQYRGVKGVDNTFFMGHSTDDDGNKIRDYGTGTQLETGAAVSPLLKSSSKGSPLLKSSSKGDGSNLSSIMPSSEDSNKDLSVNIAQNPSEGGGDNSVEILDTITQNMGGSSGDGTGSTIQPQFDLADTSSPAVMNPESPSEFIALLTDTSNSAFR